ncbi:hypothetical protein WICMUC_004698 [Wickerhamomyces mucosus]|uniref:DNA replication complex GINS protein PSF3 n=1 Tax=Wickerhamomyces mucosus TaxID=1378264 RepID=A0A9P8TA09_9ASCO|nr:hypothetical protein WICMUC_004698 [Wickerhamomyces mucosus]
MSYYDIDDIIGDSQRLPCKFNTDAKGLGWLEGNPGKDMKSGTKLELPFWISEILAISTISSDSDITFIELLQPDALNKKVLNAIKTSSISLDLHSISTNYYSLVEKWAGLYNDEELVQVIGDMLKERSDEINNYAQNFKGNQQESGFLYSLDEFEKKLYKITHESYKNLKKWLNNQ